ncbi:3-hydroxy-D-aspartate aldolase [Aquicella siphonis]|uniref:3-hydroxy-D-aspartate aldolase n=1 Tax=Aquicella siphonis TaxID=254247 RepID=A0A5E4PHB1_9COXI|nr:alanine racemase [Aquicella siphonis]VVC75837.1 3-hydroxy-D-aspartate aldolase [Aquicella siphonis]
MTLKHASQEHQAAGTGIPGNMGLDHVGIVVPNALEAAEFLIDAFDAEFDWEVRRDPAPSAGERGWDAIFGVHPDAYMPHVIMLKCGEHPLTQYIEIFEWKSPDQSLPRGENGWHKMSDIGNNYISFTVKDMEKVVTHIKERVFPKWKNTRFIQDPPMQFPLRGEICTSTFLVSPWGMWIELTCWSRSRENGQVIKAQRKIEKNKYIGASIHALPTPAFMIDLDALDHNIQLMSRRIAGNGIAWRIPCKAHKCPELAKYIIRQGGVDGVVLLTLAEAESFARQGIDNIYLANQAGSEAELERISLLAKQVRVLRVAVDDPGYLRKLAAAVERWEIIAPVEVLVELNINHNRCGVDTIDQAVALSRLTKEIESRTGSVLFRGITGYEGHTPVMPPEQKTLETRRSHAILAQARHAIEAEGITVEVVSGGGSCNYPDCLSAGVLTEIQAGGGALCDLLYYHKADLKQHGHKIGALLLTQVISAAADQSRAIANAGFKTAGWHPFGGLPEPRDRKDLKIIGLSAEHTKIESIIEKHPVNLAHGDKIVLIPGYTDAMGFLHREIYAIRHDIVEQVWKTV